MICLSHQRSFNYGNMAYACYTIHGVGLHVFMNNTGGTAVQTSTVT
jgi:hypothetical protein